MFFFYFYLGLKSKNAKLSTTFTSRPANYDLNDCTEEEAVNNLDDDIFLEKNVEYSSENFVGMEEDEENLEEENLKEENLEEENLEEEPS